AEQILGVEIRTQLLRCRPIEQLDGDAQAPLELGAPTRGRQLLLRPHQDEITVLTEVGIDAELLLKTLVRHDRVRGQLDAQPVGVLGANAAARERRGAGAHSVALQDDDAACAQPRQMVGGARAHDSGADNDDLGRFSHRSIPFNAALIRGAVTGTRRAAAGPTAAATAFATAARTPDAQGVRPTVPWLIPPDQPAER